jgi:tRNA 2-thiouridine synthesizing protein A
MDEPKGRKSMTENGTLFLDTVGLKCPEPILKIAIIAADMKPNDILDVVGDCPTFEQDVRDWCKRLNRRLVFVRNVDGKKMIRIQK